MQLHNHNVFLLHHSCRYKDGTFDRIVLLWAASHHTILHDLHVRYRSSLFSLNMFHARIQEYQRTLKLNKKSLVFKLYYNTKTWEKSDIKIEYARMIYIPINSEIYVHATVRTFSLAVTYFIFQAGNWTQPHWKYICFVIYVFQCIIHLLHWESNILCYQVRRFLSCLFHKHSQHLEKGKLWRHHPTKRVSMKEAEMQDKYIWLNNRISSSSTIRNKFSK